MQTQQKNIREDNFHFVKHSISIYISSVDTTEKLELIGKITLYATSQGQLKPCMNIGEISIWNIA